MTQQEMFDDHLSPHAKTILAMREWTPEVPENGLMSLMLTMDVITASRRDLFLLTVGLKQIVAGFKAIGELPPSEIVSREEEVRLAFLAHD